jgi:hypothetical protein
MPKRIKESGNKNRNKKGTDLPFHSGIEIYVVTILS